MSVRLEGFIGIIWRHVGLTGIKTLSPKTGGKVYPSARCHFFSGARGRLRSPSGGEDGTLLVRV